MTGSAATDNIVSRYEAIDTVLFRAAKEAEFLHDELMQFEREISQMIATTEAMDISGLQRLDSLSQTMAGLSRFLTHLAITVDTAGKCDSAGAIGTLTLRTQAHRLSAPSGNMPPASEPEPELW